MAVPTYVDAGASDAGIGAITPALPTGYAIDDILFLLVETANEAVALPAGGWAELGDQANRATGTAAGTSATRLAVFWLRATSTSHSAPTVADSGNHNVGIVFAVRGCIATGNPWNTAASSIDATSDTSVSIAGVTTTVNDCLVLHAYTSSFDSGTDQLSGTPANATLTNVVTHFDANAAAGNGGTIILTSGTKATAGATGTLTATYLNAAVKGQLVVALQPATAVDHAAGVISVTGTGADAVAASTRETFSGALTTQDTGAAAIAGATRETFSGVLAAQDTGAVAIAGATRETFTGALSLSDTGAVALGGAVWETFTQLAVADTGTVAVNDATRGTFAGALAVSDTGIVTLAGATRETFSGVLSLSDTGFVTVGTLGRETFAGALSVADTSAVTLSGAVRETFAILGVTDTGIVLVADATILGGFDEWFTVLNVTDTGLVVVGTSYSTTVLADSPRWYLRLGELSGTVAQDATANNLDGVYVASPTLGAAGLVSGGNKAVYFDGLDDCVRVPDTTHPTAYTLEAIVKPTGTGEQNIVWRTSDEVSTHSHRLCITGGVFRHTTYDGTTRNVTGTTAVVPGTTYHVVGTAVNGGAVRLYVNGVEEGTPFTPLGTLWAGGDRWMIGKQVAATGWFNGTIDEAALYSSVLTDAQILAHAQAVLRGEPVRETFSVLATADTGLVTVGVPLRDTFSGALAVADTGAIVLSSATRGTFSGALGLSDTAAVTLAGATRNTFTGALSLSDTGLVTVGTLSQGHFTGALSVADTGAVALSGAVREAFAVLGVTSTGIVVVADASTVVEHFAGLLTVSDTGLVTVADAARETFAVLGVTDTGIVLVAATHHFGEIVTRGTHIRTFRPK